MSKSRSPKLARAFVFLALSAFALHSVGMSRRESRGVERAQIYVPAKPAISSRFANPEGMGKLMSVALVEIPKRSEGHALAESRLLDAANAIELIAEASKLNPALKGDAMRFFRTCALNRKFQDAFRAVCYREFSTVTSGTKGTPSIRLSSRIRRIAHRL